MGIKGLLPCLQSITRSVSLERYRGLTVAVDAMSWLHKGVFACDVKALAKSQRGRSETSSSSSADIKCVNFTIKKAETLRSNFGMEVILVIDGDSLPCKKEENEKRRAERDEAFQKAMAAEQGGDSRAARRFYAQSCSVTHKIRYELIKACKQAGIAFLVAPYEADAQMARMAHTGMVDLVITEDSDTLAYGCPRVLFKIDFDSSQGQEIQLMRDLGKNESPSFRNWTHDMFVFMCILSGCDYCEGIHGIGIKLAHKIVRVHRTPSKIFTALRVAGRMTRDFEDRFWIAFRTFRHQRVYCPSKQQIETLWPIAGSNHDANPNEVWPFLGGYIDPRIATKIADGTLHPATKTDWSSALRQQDSVDTRHSNTYSVGEIHHRKPNRNEARRDHHSNANWKENIWHSLVYGGGEDDAPRGKNRDCNNQSKQVEPSKNDMFSFFPKNKHKDRDKDDSKKRHRDDNADGDVRPPLTEIYLGGLGSGNSTSNTNKSMYVPPASHKDVPIHFHEYSSRLVGKSFKPMSRKRRKETNCGSKSSRCVQKIWEKSNKAQTHHAETHQAAVRTSAAPNDNHKTKEDQGVSLFKKDKSAKDQQCPNGLLALQSGENDSESGGQCWDSLYYTESYGVEHSSMTHHQPSSSFVDDVQHDDAGISSLTRHQPSTSFFDYDNQTQPLQSDSSFAGAYTTVTAEPQDLFSARPNEVYDNLFAEDFSIGTCERNYGEDASYVSKQYPVEPTLYFQPTHHADDTAHFDSSFDPQMGMRSERYGDFGNNANTVVYEEDIFSNFQIPEDNYDRREEEYSHIDDGLLSDLAIMQQM
jgi:exonuclease-1